jgi:hypothetical protein
MRLGDLAEWFEDGIASRARIQGYLCGMKIGSLARWDKDRKSILASWDVNGKSIAGWDDDRKRTAGLLMIGSL